MLDILKIILSSIGYIWTVWVGFVACMALQRVRTLGQLHGIALIFAYVLLAIFIPLDFILNTIPATILFLEFPRWTGGEWLFTARMKRYYYRVVINPNILEKWRKYLGKFITEGLLNNISLAVGDGNHV